MKRGDEATYLAQVRDCFNRAAIDEKLVRARYPEDDLWVGDLHVVHDGLYPELELEFRLTSPKAPGLASMVARVPFDKVWLHLTDMDDQPERLAEELWTAIFRRADLEINGDHHRLERIASAPTARELWRGFLARLAENGVVHEVAPGELHLARRGRPDCTVLITPQQWREMWALHVDRWENDDDEFDENPSSSAAYSGGNDDPYLVFYDGILHPSIRRELPPVSSETASAAQQAREFRKSGGVGWFAFTPLQQDPPQHRPDNTSQN